MKKKNWITIGYPESLDSDWISILESRGIRCAISPLHDKDVTTLGDLKKPHYHIILSFDGPTTYKNVCNICSSIKSSLPLPCDSISGYYDYLTHKNNLDKYQYNSDDIILLNGFNINSISLGYNVSITDIVNVIEGYNITEFDDLVNFMLSYGEEHLIFLSKNAFFFDKILTSRRLKH